MNIINLERVLSHEPKYRLKQAKEAVFKNLIENWLEAKVLPLDLREKLNKECMLDINAIFSSREKEVIKSRIILEDGLSVETVLMKHNDARNTVCVSSAVGCLLTCTFCATGKMGFKRNLSAMEIIEQVLFFARLLKKENARVSNIVFMGMGEPFLNYENVLAAIRILNDKEGLNIGARHISISTAGITEGIKKLAEEKLQINLAVSLHAPNNGLRSKIMPINKKYYIEKILATVDEYIKKTKRQVMFEYILIKDINDSDKFARELAALVKKPLYFLNLILYNPTGLPGFKPSSSARIKQFKEILRKNKIKFSQRFRFGEKIKAACGQLKF
jgi:23S rRNA (adenine2503-C2)-methyltransferase